MAREWHIPPRSAAPPDFSNVLAVLGRGKPKRPTLFEFFLNDRLYRTLAGQEHEPSSLLEHGRLWIRAFANAGYDYATLPSFILNAFHFPTDARAHAASVSMNQGSVIHDRASYEAYKWPDAAAADYSMLDTLAADIPEGMKLIVSGPGGILENAMSLVGYEDLCYMVMDDQDLAWEIFEAIETRLLAYYRTCLGHDTVGAIIGNDDWGFKSQTMLSPSDLQRFVFPCHRRIVQAAHAVGKPAILHSCGCLGPVMDGIIDDLKYDAKHSYEDTIMPVEVAYDTYRSRIAIMGGIDLDFVCRSSPEQVYERSRAMLDRAQAAGAYALGTGNSVPAYVPDQNYFAMIRAALDQR